MNTTEPVPSSNSIATVRDRRRPESVRRFNVIYFLLDTAFFYFALSLVDMSSVMPSLLGHLTSQPVLIGLVGSTQTACWLLPQLLGGWVVAAKRRKLPIVLLGTGLSRLSWIFLLGALLNPDLVGPRLTLVAAYLSIGLFYLLDGTASLAWFDLVAKAVPPTMRGRMFGVMSLNGIFGVAGGLVVRQIIGSRFLPYPADYRILVMAALAVFAIGIIPLFLVDEPEGVPAPPREAFSDYVRRLPSLLRDRPAFRRIVELQLLVGASALAVPFYAPFAVRTLGLAEDSIGTFIVGMTLGSMGGGFVWGFLADHGKKHVAIRALAMFALLAPTIALVLSVAYRTLPTGVGSVLMTVAMFAVGSSTRSAWVAYANFVMDIATTPERPILIGLMNTLGGTLAIMPPLGGLLAGWFGYEATFAVAAIPAAVGLVLSLRLRASKAIQAK